jgi:acetylornithine deacetylase/succinyl-diaminopimelate desuccinylase-like protein
VASTPSATPITDRHLEQLYELLRIPSVSSDGRHPGELRQAADWVAHLIGEATVTEAYGNPLVDGHIPASVTGAPTVLIYGHYDVQSPGPDELWTSPAFDPQVRDGWLYARGVSDDKGNFFALLRAALDLAEAGLLGVNVRVLCDGEEEVGGHSVIDHLASLDDSFAAAVIFDAHMVDAHRPAITTGLRGLVGFQLRLTTGERELHSGMYGGAAANAVHDLHRVLASVIDHEDEFADGIAPVSDSERAGWASLPTGSELLAEAGAAPRDPRAADEAYERLWARPSLTVHSFGAGDPLLHKTSIANEARASLSLRLAPGQQAEVMHERLEARLRAACPPHATLDLLAWPPAQPAYVDPEQPALRAAFDAVERATGARPLAVRSGGSIPVGAALAARGTPTVITGFGSAEDSIHSPDERMELRRLEWAYAAAAELYRTFGVESVAASV